MTFKDKKRAAADMIRKHQEATNRVNQHRQHQADGTTTDRDLPAYDDAVHQIIKMGYTPAQAREATTRYFEAANQTQGGPNIEHFLNMVAVAGLVTPPDNTDR